MRVGRAVIVGIALFATLEQVSAQRALPPVTEGQDRVSFTGAVTKVEFHGSRMTLYLDVKDPATGRVISQTCELINPSALQGRDPVRPRLRIGQIVVVEGAAGADGSGRVVVSRITSLDGTILFMSNSPIA